MHARPRKRDIFILVLFVDTFSRVHTLTDGRCSEEGAACQESSTDQVDSDSLWEEWNTWSYCSVTCGTGVRVRSRSCLVLDVELTCEGLLHTEEPCFLMACPNDKAGKPKAGSKSEEAFDGETADNTANDQEHTGDSQPNGNHDDGVYDDIDDDGHLHDNDADVDDEIVAEHADDAHAAPNDDNTQDNEQERVNNGDDVDVNPDADATQDDSTLGEDQRDADGDANDDTINDGPQGDDDTTHEKSEDTKPSSDGHENNSFEDDEDGPRDDADDDDGAHDEDGDDFDDQQDEGENEGSRTKSKRRHTSTASDKGDMEDDDEISADDEPGGESGNDEDDEGDADEDDEDEHGDKKKRRRPRPEDEEDEEEEDKDEEEEEDKKRKRRRKKKKKRRRKKAKSKPEGDDENNKLPDKDVISPESCTAIQDSAHTGLSPNPAVSQSSIESNHNNLSQTTSYTSGEVETEDSSESSSWSTGDESDTSESYTSDSNEDYTYSFSESVFSSGFSSPISPPGSPSDDPCADAAEHLARLCQLSKGGRGVSPDEERQMSAGKLLFSQEVNSGEEHPGSLSPIQSSIRDLEDDTGIGGSKFMSELSEGADSISQDSSPVPKLPELSMSSPVSPVEPIRFGSSGYEYLGISSTSSLEHSSIVTCSKKRLQSTFIDEKDHDIFPSEKPSGDSLIDSGYPDKNLTSDLEVAESSNN